MKLKDFIKTAITDITSAVSELQGSLENGAIINPGLPKEIPGQTITEGLSVRKIETIKFDIAVTASTDKTAKGSMGITVLGASVGKKSVAEESSRLTFDIPVVFPTAPMKSDAEKFEDASGRNRPPRPTYEEES